MAERRIATIFGTAASGKDTLLKSLADDSYYVRLVNTTTRPPRSTEVDGKEYYFIDKETHQTNIASGKYFTYSQAHGRNYGVLSTEIESAWNSGALPIGHFGVSDHEDIWTRADSGLLCVRSLLLVTPNFDAWRMRMQCRLDSGLIDQEEVLSRAYTARDELGFAKSNINRFALIRSVSEIAVKQSVDNYLKYNNADSRSESIVIELAEEFDDFLHAQREV